MKLTKVFHLKPTKVQQIILGHLTYCVSKLWNVCNYARYNSKEFQSAYDQQKEFKNNFWYKNLPSQSAQAVIAKLESAWKSFFSAKKNDKLENPRPPKFKPKTHHSTITFKRNNFKIIDNKIRLTISKQSKEYLKEKYSIESKYFPAMVIDEFPSHFRDLFVGHSLFQEPLHQILIDVLGAPAPVVSQVDNQLGETTGCARKEQMDSRPVWPHMLVCERLDSYVANALNEHEADTITARCVEKLARKMTRPFLGRYGTTRDDLVRAEEVDSPALEVFAFVDQQEFTIKVFRWAWDNTDPCTAPYVLELGLASHSFDGKNLQAPRDTSTVLLVVCLGHVFVSPSCQSEGGGDGQCSAD